MDKIIHCFCMINLHSFLMTVEVVVVVDMVEAAVMDMVAIKGVLVKALVGPQMLIEINYIVLIVGEINIHEKLARIS